MSGINKIILIGNGFDLAQIKRDTPNTSYKDFILWWCNEIIQTLNEQNQDATRENIEIENKLIKIGPRSKITSKDVFKKIEDLRHFIPEISKYINNGLGVKYSYLLEKIMIDHTINNWVDIEQIYYNCLLEIFQQKEKQTSIEQLNASLVELRNQLAYYLKTIKIVPPEQQMNAYEKLFLQVIPEKEGEQNGRERMGWYKESYNNIYFVNFNYTDILTSFVENSRDTNLKLENIIPIHGTLEDPNTMIFGYGDEMDKNYKDIKDFNDNQYLQHIKSFDYLSAGHYHRLLNIIEAMTYDVLIMGHSCGLSDRVLLHTIFTHKNCKKIKVLYREKEAWEFKDRIMNIARHFNDTASFRKKLVDKTAPDSFMP
jgi:hypothetical protein